MSANSPDKSERREYRKRRWRGTPIPKLFPFSRLVISIVLSGANSGVSILRHKWNPTLPEPHVGAEMLWFIAVGIIVYMVFYAMEWSWNYVEVSPAVLDKQKRSEITELTDRLRAVEPSLDRQRKTRITFCRSDGRRKEFRNSDNHSSEWRRVHSFKPAIERLD